MSELWQVVRLNQIHYVIAEGTTIAYSTEDSDPRGERLKYLVDCANKGRQERQSDNELQRAANIRADERYANVVEYAERAAATVTNASNELDMVLRFIQGIKR